jgi:hypothetical protein
MDGDHSFDNSHLDHHDSHSGLPDTGHETSQHETNGGHYQPPNGTYQYAHSPAQPQGQQPSQAHSQHQFQAQPQHYQNTDMYHNSGQGQVPQAPIGSPLPNNMPPMTSMGYMTGYPSNMGQGNAQMRYQLPGDPNKMLSGNRHKKEVKRRTKTGCLTCRKRRIKVSGKLASWQVRKFVVSRGGVSLVPAPRLRFCQIHRNLPFCAFHFFTLTKSLISILLSVTKPIPCAEIASKANASAWATILCLGPKHQLLRLSSQLLIPLLRLLSTPRALLLYQRHLPILPHPQGTCPLLLNHLRPLSTPSHHPSLTITTSTELPLILRWTIQIIQTCRTPCNAHRASPHTKVSSNWHCAG